MVSAQAAEGGMEMKKRRVFTYAFCVVFGFSVPVLGQVVGSGSGTADGSDEVVIEEITVTAQKQAQTLQKTAAAVTAVTGESLTNLGVTNLASVQNLIPLVRLQQESASTEIYIRGVGSTLDLPMIEMPNAYNINDVYTPREISSLSLFDLERIEVLPGPQGTLYGRGSLGGVVNTIWRRPGDGLESTALVEIGNYSLIHVTATQNLPFSDVLRVRLGVNGNFRNGYQQSGADSAEDIAGRLGLDYSPGERFSIYVWGQFERRDGFAANLLSKGSFADPQSQAFPHPGDPYNDLLDGPLAGFASLGQVDAQKRSWRAAVVGAELNWVLSEALSLTYIPSYQDLNWHQGYWITHKLSDFNEKINQTTHELRLHYDAGGRLRWLAGLYGYRLETRGQLIIQFGPDELFPTAPVLWLDATDIRNHRLKGFSVFGQFTYDLAARLRLVAGGRLSLDRRFASGLVPAPFAFGAAPGVRPANLVEMAALGPFAFPWQNRKKYTNADWKAGLEYDLAEDVMAYATMQTAFQPGTFDTFPGITTPESNLQAVTVGVKSRFLAGRITINDEFFYYNYDDLLTQAFDAGSGSNRLTTADVTIYGNQLDVRYLPAPTTQIQLSVGYLHARYDRFSNPALNVFKGNQLQNAPDWTVSLGIAHDVNLAGGGFIRIQAFSRYESGFWGDFSHSPGIYQKKYTKTDATLTYHAPGDGWTLSVWVRNLEDKAVQAAAAPGSSFDPGPGAVFLEPPRTFGMRYTVKYTP